MRCDDFTSVEMCRGVVLGKGDACCRLYTVGGMDVWLGYSFGGTIVLICSLDVAGYLWSFSYHLGTGVCCHCV